jgi:hypothetical protein
MIINQTDGSGGCSSMNIVLNGIRDEVNEHQKQANVEHQLREANQPQLFGDDFLYNST